MWIICTFTSGDLPFHSDIYLENSKKCTFFVLKLILGGKKSLKLNIITLFYILIQRKGEDRLAMNPFFSGPCRSVSVAANLKFGPRGLNIPWGPRGNYIARNIFFFFFWSMREAEALSLPLEHPSLNYFYWYFVTNRSYICYNLQMP